MGKDGARYNYNTARSAEKGGQNAWATDAPIARIVSCLVVVAAALAAMPEPVAAAAIAAQPGTVNGVAALLVTGNDFSPNEVIRITGATNDGRQAVYPDARSDGNGNLSTALYAEASVVTLTATGQSSHITATVPVYSVVSTIPGVTGPAYPGQPYAAQPYPAQPYPVQAYPSQLAPLVASIGQPTSVTGTGFGVNERVSIWFTSPDASVTSYPGVIADNRGGITTTAAFPTTGLWQVTLYGQSSGATVINRFTVGGVAGIPGSLSPGIGGIPPVPMYRSM